MPLPPMKEIEGLTGKIVARAERDLSDYDSCQFIRVHFTDGTELRIELEVDPCMGADMTYDILN